MPRRLAVRHAASSRLLLLAVVFAVAAAMAAAVDSSAAATPVSRNLVRDPHFRHGTAAWFVRPGGSLSIVRGRRGHNGHRAIRLRNVSRAPQTLALNDRVNTVASTIRGATYRASAWIRTDSPGQTAAVRLMEYKGRSNHGRAHTSVWLYNRRWRHVAVTYKATAQGGSIDFNVVAWSLAPGKSVFVSQPRLVRVGYAAYRKPHGPKKSPTTPPSPSSTSSTAVPTPTDSTDPTSPDPTTSPDPATSVDPTPTPDPSDTSTSSDPTTSSEPTPPPSSAETPTPPATSSQTPAPSSSTPPPTSSSSPPPTTSPVPAGYKVVFSDDFDTLDRSKWNVRNNSWAGNEQSIDTSRPENVFVSDGALTLRARQESYTVGSTTRQYTSGYLDSIGHGSWQYGRFEMRAKLPSAQGMWPAFWLRDNTGLGEVDIMEAIGGMPTKTVQTVHQSTNGGMGRAGHEDLLTSGTTSEWHTYAVDREPGSIQWFVDGRLVFSKTVTDLSWLDSTFSEPMNIRLNLQVGGSMPNYYGKPVTGAPAGDSDFVIDYIRVYQRS